MTGRKLTGALVGAIVLFVVGFIWYGVSSIGSNPWKQLPNEEAFVSAIKSGSVPSGACTTGCGWIEPNTAAPPPSYL